MKRLTGIGMLVLAIAGATMTFSLPANAQGCSSGGGNHRGWGRHQRSMNQRWFNRNNNSNNQQFGAYNQGQYRNWFPGQNNNNTASWYYR